MSLYERQVALEDEYSTASLIAGQEQVLKDFAQGRAADTGAGRLILAKAYQASLQSYVDYLQAHSTGYAARRKGTLKKIAPEVVVMATLREILAQCANPEGLPTMQRVLGHVGRILETECMLAFMDDVSTQYTDRTVQYLDTAGTKSVSHRYRTFLSGAQNLGLEWEPWPTAERIAMGRMVVNVLYECTGLFKWTRQNQVSMYYLEPSEQLAKHFDEIQSAARAIVKYPPMLVPPMPWAGQYDGGYLGEWFRQYSPMCGIRYIKSEHKKWMLSVLNSETAAPARQAMNKAQSVPYRVNYEVLTILRTATAMRVGILGLPSFIPSPKPVFPLEEGWQKDEATPEELAEFTLWKARTSAWHTAEIKRRGRHVNILSRINELVRYSTEEALYFPTFIDWRGRLYFRSNLNPQSSDAVKGCLEFAEGKRLGAVGLKWLKIHVANCCGYDKHAPDLKEKWTEDNWEQIENFINNPLDVDAPEPDTAFTLLQAGLALQSALELDTPEDYICHVPVAMDATCSGLQHLSALTRDPVGAYYTNLVDNEQDQKADIYMRVAEVADGLKAQYSTRRIKTDDGIEVIHDPVIEHYWKERPISRNMAKKPVMTLVYGSTLISTIDSIVLDMVAAGMPTVDSPEGKTLYTLNALGTCVGKALRRGVSDTVPESAKFMKYLQGLVRSHKEDSLRWVSPIGVPVVNWATGVTDVRVNIRSMGIQRTVFQQSDNTYNTRSAANGIVPNFVHSNDAAHLCMTINDFDGQILPIHDSFATHPSDVPQMHTVLRAQFVALYSEYEMREFLEFNSIDPEEHTPPDQGVFDLNLVHNARYMFG